MSKTESEEFRCGARMVEIIKLEPLQHNAWPMLFSSTRSSRGAIYIQTIC